MKKHIALAGSMLAIIAVPTTGFVQEWDVNWQVGAELRSFLNAPILPEQLETFQPSLILQQRISRQSTDGRHQITIAPFMRLDGADGERSHVDLRKGYYRYTSDQNWSFTAGVDQVSWGKAESVHLVDIINQTDAVEDIDEEDRLGQPMLRVNYPSRYGTVDLFLMTGFRERTFPGEEGRLRFALPVDEDPVFTDGGGHSAVDVAARYSNRADFFGKWDFGISLFHGTSREPRLAVAIDGQSLIPIYDKITQGGLDLQYAKGRWLWKLESIVRDGQGETFLAGVGGIEFTLRQVLGQGVDLGFLAEYQYDDRDGGIVQESFGATTAAPIVFSNNDVFIGSRVTLSGKPDTTALIGAVVDADDQSTGVFLEAAHRIGTQWTAELESRLFINEEFDNPAYVFRDDDFITLRMTREF